MMAWEIVALTLAGLFLLALEIIIPGMIVGAVGALCLVCAVGLSYFHYGLQTGSLMLVGILAVTFTGLMVWLRIFPFTPIGKRLMLDAAIGGAPTKAMLLHKKGRALTDLRPSGTAVFDGRRVDVVAESGYIPAEEPVEVIATEGMRVVVRREARES